MAGKFFFSLTLFIFIIIFITIGTACPATPNRTPSWKAERSTEIHYPDSDNSAECSLYSLPKLVRQSSLAENKVLLSLSDSITTSDVSYSRDFQSEGVLGSGEYNFFNLMNFLNSLEFLKFHSKQ